jgi:hypothetical protein
MVPKWIAVSKNDQNILGILESIQEVHGQQAKSDKERTKLLKKLFSNMESNFAQVKSDHSQLLTISKIEEMRESSDYRGESCSTHVWKRNLDQHQIFTTHNKPCEKCFDLRLFLSNRAI